MGADRLCLDPTLVNPRVERLSCDAEIPRRRSDRETVELVCSFLLQLSALILR